MVLYGVLWDVHVVTGAVCFSSDTPGGHPSGTGTVNEAPLAVALIEVPGEAPCGTWTCTVHVSNPMMMTIP